MAADYGGVDDQSTADVVECEEDGVGGEEGFGYGDAADCAVVKGSF